MRIIASVPKDLMLRRMINAMQNTPASFPHEFKNEISALMKMGYPNVFPKMMGQYGKQLTEIFYNELEKNRIRWKSTPMLKEMIKELDNVRPHHKLDITASDNIDKDRSDFDRLVLSKKLNIEYTAYFNVTQGEKNIKLASIFVPKEARKEGIGSKFMEELTQFADRQGYVIVLTPSKDFGATSVSRLRKFYGKFGFKRNLGRNKNYLYIETMIRNPK